MLVDRKFEHENKNGNPMKKTNNLTSNEDLRSAGKFQEIGTDDTKKISGGGYVRKIAGVSLGVWGPIGSYVIKEACKY